MSQSTDLFHLQLSGTLVIVCHRVPISPTTVRYTGYSMSQSTELFHLQLSGTLVIVCHRVQNYFTYNCQVLVIVCHRVQNYYTYNCRYSGYSKSQSTELFHLQLSGTLVIVCHRVQNYFTYKCLGPVWL